MHKHRCKCKAEANQQDSHTERTLHTKTWRRRAGRLHGKVDNEKSRVRNHSGKLAERIRHSLSQLSGNDSRIHIQSARFTPRLGEGTLKDLREKVDTEKVRTGNFTQTPLDGMSLYSEPGAKAENSSLWRMASGWVPGQLQASTRICFMASAPAAVPPRQLKVGEKGEGVGRGGRGTPVFSASDLTNP